MAGVGRWVVKLIFCLLACLSMATLAQTEEKPADDSAQTDNLIGKLRPDQRSEPRIFSRNLEVITSADGSILYLRGPLEEGSYFKFAKKLRASPKVKTVYLASEGGLLMEGFLIGNLVRTEGLDSYVGHYCASACTLIHAAGKRRGIAKDARLGFHQAYRVSDEGEIIADPEGLAFARTTFLSGEVKLRPSAGAVLGLTGNERMAQLYARAGYNSDFVQKILDIKPEDMWMPSHDELNAAGALSGPDFAKLAWPGASEIAKTTVEDRMLTSVLWQQIRISRPEKFAEMRDEIWLMSNVGMDIAELAAEAKAKLAWEIESEVARLPDDLLDRYSLYLAAYGQAVRMSGYTDCDPSHDRLAPDSITSRFEAQNDALLTEMLQRPERVAPMPADIAKKSFDKRIGKLWKTGLLGYDTINKADERARCIGGLEMFEAIGALKPKDRIITFRAMFSLPDRSGQ